MKFSGLDTPASCYKEIIVSSLRLLRLIARTLKLPASPCLCAAVLLLLALPPVGCAHASLQKTQPENAAQAAQCESQSGFQALPEAWRGLAARLARDGLDGPEVHALLAQLPVDPTQDPMGRKIRELYNKKFYPRKKSRPDSPWYKGVVTQANAQLCRQFISEHKADFEHAYARYGVPANIGSALLFVETRLGKVLGDIPENAFYTLASMSVSLKPEDISQWFSKLPDYQRHYTWLEETMRQRADWAYREVRALIKHMIQDHITPDRLPGSIYGAVGLCQFMPSNISLYGADGDGDGKVDLFTTSDAIASMANYLARHGWQKGISPEREHKLLMTYNHSTVYANTIMALGALVANPDLTPDKLLPAAAQTKKRGKRK